MRRWIVISGLLLGCYELAPTPQHATSLGATSSGSIAAAEQLADRGEGFVRARPGESTRASTARLVHAIERAAASVQQSFAGSADLRVGDISAPHGGQHPRHHSHRAGRDVDLLFYLTDESGRSIPSTGFVAFSRFGLAMQGGDAYFFDDARNWHLVRSLLTDQEIQVQWIFVSRGLKSRLLRYALNHEPDPDVLLYAAYALQQPEDARAHDDHFHVRIYCSADERAVGCRDTGPRWPWLRPGVEEISGSSEGLDDTSLLDLFDREFDSAQRE